MATREELLAEIQRRGLKVPNQPTQPTQARYGGVAGLANKISPGVGNFLGDFARGMASNMGGKTDTSGLDLEKLYAQEAIKKQFDQPTDLERRAKEAAIAKDEAITKSWSDFGGTDMPTADETATQLGVDPDDMMTKPEMRTYRGRPYQVNTPTLKPMVPPKQGEQINSLRSIDQDLRRNMGMMTEGVQGYMNPTDLLQRGARGGLGSFILKVESGWKPEAREYIDFKAQSDQLFQDFRKDVTGAQAALKELGWLAPDFPEADEPPQTYYKKAVTAIKKLQEGEQLLLDNYSQQGYRVGEYRKGAMRQPAPSFESLGRPQESMQDAPGVSNLSGAVPQFNSPEEADNSGLPPGTRVMVGGRPYEI